MKLYFQEQGSGVPLLLVHGFPLDHTIFLETAHRLHGHARVVLADLRGFGRSAAASQAAGLPEMADDLVELMDDLKIEKAILGGHSMGGYIGLDFCRRYPQRAAGLALIASHSGADTGEQRQARLTNIERIRGGQARDYLLENMLPKLSRSPVVQDKLAGMMTSTPDETLIGALRSMADRPDHTQWLKQSGIPVAVICGQDDMILPVAKAVEIAALIGAMPTAVIPDAGHMPMMENPAATADALKRFLDRVAGDPA
jgi:pimeloyl-ACP methyl ester carboxylesterase